MTISEKIILLWVITLLIWIILDVLRFIVEKKRVKAEEQKAVSTYCLYKEIKRLNTRLDSYYHTQNTEDEEQE